MPISPSRAAPPGSYHEIFFGSASRKYGVGLMALLLVALLLRTVYLAADPPTHLSWSLAPYTDEGAHVLNAKNKLLFGQWVMDDWFRMGISPLFSLILWPVFEVFGVGFVTSRMVSVVAAIGVIWLLWQLLRQATSTRTAYFGAFLATISYLWIVQNRTATEESLLALVLLLAIYFWVKAPPRHWHFFMAGFLAASAVLFVKLLGIFFLPILPLEFFRQRWLVTNSPLRQFGYKPLGLFLIGGALATAIWFLWLYLPYRQELTTMWTASTVDSEGGHPGSIGAYLQNFFTLATHDGFMSQAWMIFPLGLVGLLPWISRWREKIRGASALEFVGGLWFLGVMVMLASMNYRPIRYQMLMLPALFILVSILLTRPPGSDEKKKKTNPFGWLLRFLVLGLIIYNLVWFMRHTIQTQPAFKFITSAQMAWLQTAATGKNDLRTFLPEVPIIAVAAVASWWVIGIIKRRRIATNQRPGLAPVLLWVVAAALIWADVSQYGSWITHRTYTLIQSSRALNNLPSEAVVAGPWAGAMTMETHIRAVEMQSFANVDRVLERFPVTHLAIFLTDWEETYFREHYPVEFDRSRPWKIFHFPPGPLVIFELSPDGQSRPNDVRDPS